MDFMAVLNRLCTPAFLYSVGHILILAVFVLRSFAMGVLFHNSTIVKLIVNIVLVAAWAFLLNFLCRRGVGVLSWLLVLAPFIIMVGTKNRNVDVYNPNPLSGLM